MFPVEPSGDIAGSAETNAPLSAFGPQDQIVSFSGMAASEDGGVSDRESSSEMEGRGNLRSCSDQGTPSSVPLKPSGDRFFPDVKFCAACGLGSTQVNQ